MEKLLKMADLVDRTGLTRSAIHFYVREGIISAPIKTARTMAYYTEQHVAELKEISKLKDKGYPLFYIKKMISENQNKITEIPESKEDIRRIKMNILEKAARSFSENGYSDTDITDIENLAGVDAEILIELFPDKESLFIECLDWMVKSVFIGVWSEVQDEPDPLVRIYKSAQTLLESYSDFPGLLHELDRLAKKDRRFAEKRKEFHDSISMLLKSNFFKAIESGLTEPFNVEIMSYLFIGVAEGGARLLDANEQYSAEDYLQTMLQAFEYSGTDAVKRFIKKQKKAK